MRTGPTQKGKAVPATQGRSRNQPAGSNFVQKGRANSTWANSRRPVHPNFDRHSNVGAKREKKNA